MSTVTELVARRELLWNLTLRDLRGRYKRSIFGWAWSLMNPIAFMLIYTFAFSIVLDSDPLPGDPSGLASYPFFLMSAFLPWTFFSVSVTTAMTSVVDNSALVRKVAFPREHLVISNILAGLFTFAVEFLVLAVALAFVGNIVLVWIPVLLVVTVLLVVFTAGFALALAAGNVFFRDLSYLWGIVTQAWFFSTPIVYGPILVRDRFGADSTIWKVYDNLPMAVIVRMFRNLLFDLRMPAAIDFAMLSGYAAISFVIGWTIFNRVEARFAEEL